MESGSVLPKRDWVEMTWEDFAGADQARWIAVLPVAAVEQHGPHLPLGADAYIAAAYLSRARELLPDRLFTQQELVHGIHAGAIETSILLAANPELVRAERAQTFASAGFELAREFRYLGIDRPARLGWMSQDLHASGAMGDASDATADKGKAALEFGARAFVELLGEVDRFDPARLKQGPR